MLQSSTECSLRKTLKCVQRPSCSAARLSPVGGWSKGVAERSQLITRVTCEVVTFCLPRRISPRKDFGIDHATLLFPETSIRQLFLLGLIITICIHKEIDWISPETIVGGSDIRHSKEALHHGNWGYKTSRRCRLGSGSDLKHSDGKQGSFHALFFIFLRSSISLFRCNGLQVHIGIDMYIHLQAYACRHVHLRYTLYGVDIDATLQECEEFILPSSLDETLKSQQHPWLLTLLSTHMVIEGSLRLLLPITVVILTVLVRGTCI